MTTNNSDLYGRLGIPRLVNAWGTITDIGGSVMDDRVVKAMAAASASFIDIDELMRKSGEYLARRIGVEAACITAGAAAGLVLGIGACTQSSPNQRNASVLTLRGQDTPYLRAAAGALRIVTIDPSPDIGTELRKAVTDGTVAVFIDAAVAESQGMRVAELLQAMKMSYVPVIVDAAAELPPRANLTRDCCTNR